MNKPANETIMTGESSQSTSNPSAPSTATISTITSHSSTILPEKFESGDIVLWLRQFKTCATANGWQAQDKLTKLPASLRGRAPTYFYALRDEQKASYEVLVKNFTEALCPKVDREKFHAEFENRLLRPGEDPAVFLWKLIQLLTKANPSLTEDGKTALLEGQFMRGVPARTRLKLLEQDATPSLDAMVSFAH